jgi:hypothetical protein
MIISYSLLFWGRGVSDTSDKIRCHVGAASFVKSLQRLKKAFTWHFQENIQVREVYVIYRFKNSAMKEES